MDRIAEKIARIHVIVHAAIADPVVRTHACKELLDLQELFDIGAPLSARSCKSIQRQVDKYNEERACQKKT